MIPHPVSDNASETARGWPPPSRPVLTPADHAAWRELIRERCGLDFGESRTSSLARCLWQRARTAGCRSYRDYYRLVAREDPEGEMVGLRLPGILPAHLEGCLAYCREAAETS